MSAREILEIPQNESINLLIDNAVRVGGAEPTGTIQIDENGLYDVAAYAAANVNVPEPSGSISITENGTVDVKNYASANVNVQQGVFPTGSLSITQNGSYDVAAYAEANVNVPAGPQGLSYYDITMSATTDQLTIPKPANDYYFIIVYDINRTAVNHNVLTCALVKRPSDNVMWCWSTSYGYNLQMYQSVSYVNAAEVGDNIVLSVASGNNIRFRSGETYRVLVVNNP